jgi:hypothetical protein
MLGSDPEGIERGWTEDVKELGGQEVEGPSRWVLKPPHIVTRLA